MPRQQALEDIFDAVETCLKDIGGDADGYPIEALMNDLVDAYRRGPVARDHALALVDHLLAHWVGKLDTDLQALAPPSPSAIIAIRARMRAAQSALLQAQALMQRLRLWTAAERLPVELSMA